MADWGGKIAAWFAAVAGVSTALAALIATAAKLPLHGRLRDLFIALIVIAAVSFIALVLTGPRALYGAWRSRHARKVQDLASRADLLSGELFTFAAERDRDDPVREQHSRQAGVSDGQWQREWNEFSNDLQLWELPNEVFSARVNPA
jgi:hypothetical protein